MLMPIFRLKKRSLHFDSFQKLISQTDLHISIRRSVRLSNSPYIKSREKHIEVNESLYQQRK